MAAATNTNMEILVLGMHRSGTSMVTRLLNLAGAYFGPDHQHIGHSEENPKGFWERLDVRALNDLLLHGVDAEWDRPLGLARRSVNASLLTEFENGASRVMRECQAHPSSVIKEPRMCLTLPFWRPLLKNPIYIWIQRHPLEVATSLFNRNGMPIAYGLALWEWYTVQTGLNIRHDPLILIQHSAMLNQTHTQLERILEQLGQHGCEGLALPKRETIDDFVDKKLYHARLNEQSEHQGMSSEIQHLWQVVCKSSIDWAQWPAEVSDASLNLLQVGETTAPAILKRLKETAYQRDRAEKQRDYWQGETEKTRTKANHLTQQLSLQIRNARRIQKRLNELEKAWQNLRQSKLWQLGLLANRVRSFLGRGQAQPLENQILIDSEDPPLELGKAITVIVPIYNALAAVRQCLDSVLEHTRHPHRLLLIDDASSEPDLGIFLDGLAAESPHITLIRHPANMGYTASVNEGLRWAQDDDVVLLNSDTIVPPGWLGRLQKVGYSRANIATVTPLSNAAGAFSIPNNHQINPMPAGYDVNRFAALVAHLSPRLTPQVPTGNGFCMFMRRQAIQKVGHFDTQAFPRGYGEENDFSMRASEAGFCHLIDDASFVFHHRSASFGSEKDQLVTQSQKTLSQRWPEYKTKVGQWLANDPLNPFREALTQFLQSQSLFVAEDIVETVPLLFVLHDGGGGTKLTALELMGALPKQFECYLLITGRTHWQLLGRKDNQPVALESWDFVEPWRFDEPLGLEKIALLRQICSHYAIRLAHIRHFLGNAPEITTVFRSLQIAVALSFHDFYSVCPTIHLLDRSGRFCAGDCHANDNQPSHRDFHSANSAQDCALASNWFQNPPTIRHQYLHQWRDRVKAALANVQAGVTTSHAAKAIVQRHFAHLKAIPFEIIEHGRDFAEQPSIARPPGQGPVQIVCFGALGRLKGLNLIGELAELDKEAGRFVFHLLGHVASDWVPPTEAIKIHGPYDNANLFTTLAPLQPSLALIPSLVPETYCHTLTEAWAAGLPVITSDIGTLRERVLAHDAGWLADPHQPKIWYDLLCQICNDGEAYAAKAALARRYQPVSVASMTQSYAALYEQLLSAKPTFSV